MRLRATSFLAASIVGGLMFAAPSAAQAQVACGYYTTGYNCYSSYQCGSCGGGLLTTPWAYRASPCGYYGPCQQQVYIPAVVPAPCGSCQTTAYVTPTYTYESPYVEEEEVDTAPYYPAVRPYYRNHYRHHVYERTYRRHVNYHYRYPLRRAY